MRVVEMEGRGRALIAARAIKPGEVIMSELPLLVYPAAPNSPLHRHCSHCFRSASSFSATAACQTCGAPFCSTDCLSLHETWLCAAVRSLPPQINSDELLFSAAHFLIAALSLPPSAFQTLLSLTSSAAAPGETELRNAATLCSILSFLPPPPCGIPTIISVDLAAALLAFDKRNAFGLMEPVSSLDGERRVRAYAIYPTASLFNHDCLPNACRFDYLDAACVNSCRRSNTSIVVRAIHDIASGREVCISYFPVNWGYRERQRRLLEDYGFVCRCDRCEVEKNWKDNEDEGEDAMEDDMEEEEEEEVGDDDDQEGKDEMEDEGADFPHAYFFVSFVCDRENCGGTLAPLPPSVDGIPSEVMECNVCGRLRKHDDVAGASYMAAD